MSRSAVNVWSRRARRRFDRTASDTKHSGTPFDVALTAVARHLQCDPFVLLGALASEPAPEGLWNEIERFVRRQSGRRTGDWNELAAAAEMLASSTRPQALSCWVAEPSDPVEVFALASCLALAARGVPLTVLATHSDPLFAEIGRSGLLSETAIRPAPSANRDVHFRRLGHCWEAAPALRAAVHFATTSPFGDGRDHAHLSSAGYDLVVSRGLLSRLAAPSMHRLALQLVRAVRNEGFILVGSAEHDVPPLAELERCVAPGVLLYRKRRNARSADHSWLPAVDFAALLHAVEIDPTAWEPRWHLARVLLQEGHAEPALAHLREVARQRPDTPGIWKALAQAYTLLGDTGAAEIAAGRCLPVSAVANAA